MVGTTRQEGLGGRCSLWGTAAGCFVGKEFLMLHVGQDGELQPPAPASPTSLSSPEF